VTGLTVELVKRSLERKPAKAACYIEKEGNKGNEGNKGKSGTNTKRVHACENRAEKVS
jgi:hypothetical protein